jgi:polysaccharide export outer membrane protein
VGQKETLLIGPGDLVHIVVFDTPELEQHARVTDSGELTLLMGGKVQIGNLTPAQAAATVEEALRQGGFLNHPRVSILIDAYATQSVYVLGEVKSPGERAIGTPRSVLDVLSMSGGLTELADRKVLIERRSTKEKIPYFVSNDSRAALDSAVMVFPGDSVIVPRAGVVYILGDVARPGGYTMTNNEAQVTVLQLVARAGGTNHSAVPSHAKLIRKLAPGYIEEALPLSAMQKGKLADMPLIADDIIYVPFSYLRNFSMQAAGVAGQVGAATVYHF